MGKLFVPKGVADSLKMRAMGLRVGRSKGAAQTDATKNENCGRYGRMLVRAAKLVCKSGKLRVYPASKKYSHTISFGADAIKLTMIRSKVRGAFFFLEAYVEDAQGQQRKFFSCLKQKGREAKVRLPLCDSNLADRILDEAERVKAEDTPLARDRRKMGILLLGRMGAVPVDIR